MTVAVIGYGVEGRSAARYWRNLGHTVTVADANEGAQVPAEFGRILGPGYLDRLTDFHLVVRTPSVRPDLIHTRGRVTSVTGEFMRRCPAPIIGVTGTKGKGTTATLIARILEATGHTVWLAGNIGRSPLDFVGQVQPDHFVVLELSSFQLMDLKTSPQVAVCLMIAPEHLNWHVDMAEYVEAKAQLFRFQRPDDLAVFKHDDPNSIAIAAGSAGRKLGYGTAPAARVEDGRIKIEDVVICSTQEVGLVGPHNLQNIAAAVTATWELVSRDVLAVRDAVTTFTGLEHRIELAGEVEGVRYYDDSFSTTPEAAIAAIRSFKEPKVIILGGSDKGADYTELAEVVEHEGVIHAFLIGDTAPAIETALRAVGFTHFTHRYTGMKALLLDCYAVTEPGDVVLLSPACASFGLFENYKDRGDQFKAAVLSLYR